AYIHRDLRRSVPLLIIPAILVLATSLFVLYLDRMDYDLLTEGYIETTDYWTSKVHRFSYGDVDAVEVACAEDDDGDLELSYVLKIGESRTIRAVDLDTPREFRERLPERLEAWTKVDAKLRAAGVPVRHAGFDADACRAGLTGLTGGERRDRVMPLLRKSGAAALFP
ncbi:MAG: hypothetical protein ACLFV8_08440, partial [Alphaproteobacteria bacterium]